MSKLKIVNFKKENRIILNKMKILVMNSIAFTDPATNIILPLCNSLVNFPLAPQNKNKMKEWTLFKISEKLFVLDVLVTRLS